MSPLKVARQWRHTLLTIALPVGGEVSSTLSRLYDVLRLIGVREVHDRLTSHLISHPVGNRRILYLYLHFLGYRTVLLSLCWRLCIVHRSLEGAGKGLGRELVLLVAVVMVQHGVLLLSGALCVVLSEIGWDHTKLPFDGRTELPEVNACGGVFPMTISIGAVDEVVRQFRLLSCLGRGSGLGTLVQVLVATLAAMLYIESTHGGGRIRKDLFVFRMPISIILTSLRLLIRHE